MRKNYLWILWICTITSCNPKENVLLEKGEYKVIEHLSLGLVKETHYYPSGNAKYHLWLLNGKRDSSATYYSEDGKTRVETSYKNGVQSKKHVIYIDNRPINDTLSTRVNKQAEVGVDELFKAKVQFSDSSIRIYRAYYFCDPIFKQEGLDSTMMIPSNECYRLAVVENKAEIQFSLGSPGKRIHKGFLLRKLFESDFLAFHPFEIIVDVK